MKRVSLVSVFISLMFCAAPAALFAQPVYNDFLAHLFFGRQPSARSEALGKSGVALDEDVSSSFFNPAGIASMKGISFTASYATPYYTADKASYTYLGFGYHVNGYGSIAFSRNHFSYGMEFERRTSSNEFLGTLRPTETFYTLNIATENINDIRVGINLNALLYRQHLTAVTEQETLSQPDFTLYPVDLGIQKKFLLSNDSDFVHHLVLGGSIFNLTNARVTIDGNAEVLPVLVRIGCAYNFKLQPVISMGHAPAISSTITIEYQDLLNSKYRSGFRGGVELSSLDMISVRIGYYIESSDTHNFKENKSELTSLTFGAGLRFPVSVFTENRIPLTLSFDFTQLEQPTGSTSPYFSNLGNFTDYTLNINYQL